METTAQLRALLQPPDARASEAHASAHLRDAFPSSSTSSQNDADVAKALAQALEAQTSKYDALRTDVRPVRLLPQSSLTFLTFSVAHIV